MQICFYKKKNIFRQLIYIEKQIEIWMLGNY